MKLLTTSLLSSLFFAAACTADDGGEGATEVSGQAVYRDATTTPAGAPAAPAAPPAQEVSVSIVVEGQGDLPELDPQCALDPAGAFEAHLIGEAALGDDGAYAGAVGDGAVEIVTPSGCEIPELTVGVVTDIKVRAELEATAPNCQTYCAASARADAEAACGTDAGAAECRAELAAEAEAACTTTCASGSRVIVAETYVGAGALGELDADMLQAAALGHVEAALTFDRIE